MLQTDVGTVTVSVIRVNRAPSLLGATFFVPEGSDVNTPVGAEPNATGEARSCGPGVCTATVCSLPWS